MITENTTSNQPIQQEITGLLSQLLASNPNFPVTPDLVDILKKKVERGSHVDESALTSPSRVYSPASESRRDDYNECLNDNGFFDREMQQLFARKGRLAAHKSRKPIFRQFEIVPDVTTTVRCDPEIARLSIAFNSAHHLRIWAILRDMTRREDGSGNIRRKELLSNLKTQYGVVYTRQRLNQILKSGHETYWNATRSRIYIASQKTVGRRLAQRAYEENPALVINNRPGAVDMYIRTAGTLEEFEAQIYAAWHAHRSAKMISRETLELLFNRTQETLRTWERKRLRGELKVVSNYSQTLDPLLAAPHAQVASTRKGDLLYVERLPNTYQSKTRQHYRRGSSRKTRSLMNTITPAEMTRRVPKQYFEDAKRAQMFCKRHNNVVYLLRGFRRKNGVWEPSRDGYSETYVGTRAGFRKEYLFLYSKTENKFGVH